MKIKGSSVNLMLRVYFSIYTFIDKLISNIVYEQIKKKVQNTSRIASTVFDQLEKEIYK